jgi:GT2 family glycosyltransferase
MISVIVLNWNGRQHLETCLTALARQVFPDFEVILVDNGSVDSSVEFVKASFPAVRVIALDQNLGFCAGNNSGIRASQGELIATLNNDTEADQGWLAALHDAAQRWPGMGCFASKMLFFDQRSWLDDAGDELHTAGFATKRGWLEPDGPPYDTEVEVFGPCAGAALYRRAMLNEVGLFDESFFANGEDVDLSFRARLKGYRCLYIPSAVVYHKVGASIGQTNRWLYWMRRNQIWLLLKNMPAPLLLKYAPEIIIYNVLSLLYHSQRGRGRLIWQAYFDAFRDIRRILAQRREIQTGRVASLSDIETALTKGQLFNRMKHPVTAKPDTGKFYRLVED